MKDEYIMDKANFKELYETLDNLINVSVKLADRVEMVEKVVIKQNQVLCEISKTDIAKLEVEEIVSEGKARGVNLWTK